MPRTEYEIREELRKRTTPELKAFQKKLKGIETGQAYAIRYFIVIELLTRYQVARWTGQSYGD